MDGRVTAEAVSTYRAFTSRLVMCIKRHDDDALNKMFNDIYQYAKVSRTDHRVLVLNELSEMKVDYLADASKVLFLSLSNNNHVVFDGLLEFNFSLNLERFSPDGVLLWLLKTGVKNEINYSKIFNIYLKYIALDEFSSNIIEINLAKQLVAWSFDDIQAGVDVFTVAGFKNMIARFFGKVKYFDLLEVQHGLDDGCDETMLDLLIEDIIKLISLSPKRKKDIGGNGLSKVIDFKVWLLVILTENDFAMNSSKSASNLAIIQAKYPAYFKCAAKKEDDAALSMVVDADIDCRKSALHTISVIKFSADQDKTFDGYGEGAKKDDEKKQSFMISDARVKVIVE